MLSLEKHNIRILLLEGVHQSAIDYLRQAGYTNIETLKTALPEKDLVKRIKGVHFLGIRSRTHIDNAVLAAADKLIGIGCFCIGTNQVDLTAAAKHGVPVFNAPFANTRSVAELTIASTICLMRGTFTKSMAAHKGEWLKSAQDSYEVRGKKLGIVGYGNIGSQLSVLASSLGMDVYYYDIEKKLGHGNARSVQSLPELLALCDVTTLHVPETPETRNMMNATAIAQMKPGSYLINYARGNLVDIDALAAALKSGQVRGAALDVFPLEPKSKDERFDSALQGLENVILTPHVGGSTQEAQQNIGLEVAEKLVMYSDDGSTVSAVNFPAVSSPVQVQARRFLNIHQNRPGVMNEINKVFSQAGVNVLGQFLQTTDELGYVVIDVGMEADLQTLKGALEKINGSIRTRLLY